MACIASPAETISPSPFVAEDANGSALICGDAEAVLSGFPTCIFQSCVTSPPYWSLRDYGVPGQIGLEDAVAGYIDRLVTVFSQVRRVLSDDGTLWLNIGDGYTSGGRTSRAPDKKNPARAMNVRPPTLEGLKAKDLIGVPWLLAFALQRDGWYLRADIIWNKSNCQPESVRDRPTRSHEYVFYSARASTTDMTPPRCADRTAAISEPSGTFPPDLIRRRILLPTALALVMEPLCGLADSLGRGVHRTLTYVDTSSRPRGACQSAR